MDINQELLNELKIEIRKNGKETVEEYYGVQITVYKDLDKYLERLPSIYDKISLSQWANNYKLVNQLISNVQMDEEQQRKYDELLLNNADLNETIDLRMLTQKYDFLDDMLDMIVTNRDVQEQILSLSNEKLEIFKQLYARLEEVEEYRVPQLTAILNRMGTITPFSFWQNNFYRYSELEESISNNMKNDKFLSEEEIDNLLYLYTTNLVWDVKTAEDLTNFVHENGKFYQSIDQMIDEQEQAEEKDPDVIKNALLLKTFGIDLIGAKAICDRYDLNSIEITDNNIDLFTMYRAIIEILKEDNSELLLNAYKEFSKQMNPKPNFMRTVVFENALRKEFAKKLNQSVYKCNGTPDIVNGIPIYDAGTDFKMIVTAIGAYKSDFESKENYKDYWNGPRIRSHGNCCSLIANNNLSMATPKNVIFGFSTMDENMLLLSSTKDINSTPESRKFNIAQEESNGSNRTIDGKPINSLQRIGLGIEFTNPDILINNTRGGYNELVYERRDLSSNPLFYKKNPDYIVFIEEYENIDSYLEYYKNDPEKLAYLEEQKRLQQYQFQESLKAAKDFKVPIVKINREKCAKASISHIEELMKQFEDTKDASLISTIICEFENNRVGNHDMHALIRDKYFSKDTMSEILNRIENTISSISDYKEKDNLIEEYHDSLLKEQKKVQICKKYRKNGQTSGIDFDKTFERINAMNYDNLMVEKQSGKPLPIRR